MKGRSPVLRPRVSKPVPSRVLKSKRAGSVRSSVGFPAASPEQLGMSRAVLSKVRSGTRLEVRQLGSIAGAAHIVLRRGRCALALADGWADRERGKRFRLDSLCRLHGSTKSLVAAAFLTLVDDGLVSLDDPVQKYTPFSDRVAVGKVGSRPARSKATLRHLLTMTAGLSYTDCPAYAKVIAEVRRGKITDLAAFCDALAAVPLQFEPGTQHWYSFCTDIIGRVCEVVSGQNLDTFMAQRLCRPLGMRDTHFVVPRAKLSRCAVLYECRARSKAASRGGMAYRPVRWIRSTEGSAPGIMAAGGGILSYLDAGMWGTARDYAKFCQMLLDSGLAINGKTRVLRASTVRMIWSDGLAPFAGKDGRLPGWNVDDTEGPPCEGGSWDQCGFSLVNSMLQGLKGPPKHSAPARRGTAMGLGGGGGTSWYADIKRQLVAISFTQSFDGGRQEGDGLGPPGNDCLDLAIEAVDAGKRKSKVSK